MRRPARPSLTYANVMSTVAAFIALGGVSWAAVTLPAGSVGTAQLKTNAVTTSKIKNGTIKQDDLAPGVVKIGPAGATGQAGPQGPQGPQGTKGEQGIQGPPGDAASTAGLVAGGPRTVKTYRFTQSGTKLVPIQAGAVAGSIKLSCIASGGNGAFNAGFQNGSSAPSQVVYLASQFGRGDSASPVFGAIGVPLGQFSGTGYLTSSTPSLGMWWRAHLLGTDGTSVAVDVHAVSEVGGFDTCSASVTTQTDAPGLTDVP